MKPYIITDTHFFHTDKMIEYCDRPADYGRRLVIGFEKLVATDLLIHLGDICLGNDVLSHAIISDIKAKTILVKGNHDPKSNNWYLNHGWDFVCETFMDTYFGTKVRFSHKPVPWDGVFDINIHGHLHNLGRHPETPTNCMNHLVSLEADGYEPQSLEAMLVKIKKERNR